MPYWDPNERRMQYTDEESAAELARINQAHPLYAETQRQRAINALLGPNNPTWTNQDVRQQQIAAINRPIQQAWERQQQQAQARPSLYQWMRLAQMEIARQNLQQPQMYVPQLGSTELQQIRESAQRYPGYGFEGNVHGIVSGRWPITGQGIRQGYYDDLWRMSGLNVPESVRQMGQRGATGYVPPDRGPMARYSVMTETGPQLFRVPAGMQGNPEQANRYIAQQASQGNYGPTPFLTELTQRYGFSPPTHEAHRAANERWQLQQFGPRPDPPPRYIPAAYDPSLVPSVPQQTPMQPQVRQYTPPRSGGYAMQRTPYQAGPAASRNLFLQPLGQRRTY